MGRDTKQNLCVYCGKEATRMNRGNQPVCTEHKDTKKKEVACPSCGMPMELREGRYGYFWGCEGYPQCEKTFNIAAILKKEGNHPEQRSNE